MGERRHVGARLGVPVDVELLAPNALPRFAFKAARVVDEEGTTA